MNTETRKQLDVILYGQLKDQLGLPDLDVSEVDTTSALKSALTQILEENK